MEKKEKPERRTYVAPVIEVRPLTQVVRGDEGTALDYFAERARPD
jgi:hypothetical protein